MPSDIDGVSLDVRRVGVVKSYSRAVVAAPENRAQRQLEDISFADTRYSRQTLSLFSHELAQAVLLVLSRLLGFLTRHPIRSPGYLKRPSNCHR
jgi:hypothetical protein